MKLGRADLLKLHANLVRARKLDELMVAALEKGKVMSFFHSGQGSVRLISSELERMSPSSPRR